MSPWKKDARAKGTAYKRRWRARPKNIEKAAKHAAYMREYWRTHPAARAKHNAQIQRRHKARLAAMSEEDKAEYLARKASRQRERYGEDDRNYRTKAVEAQKVYARRLRTAILAAYGARCVCCGETEPLFLNIDHVLGGGAKDFKAGGPQAVYRRIIAEEFPDRYRILCANCNQGLSRNGGTCPHNRGI